METAGFVQSPTVEIHLSVFVFVVIYTNELLQLEHLHIRKKRLITLPIDIHKDTVVVVRSSHQSSSGVVSRLRSAQSITILLSVWSALKGSLKGGGYHEANDQSRGNGTQRHSTPIRSCLFAVFSFTDLCSPLYIMYNESLSLSLTVCKSTARERHRWPIEAHARRVKEQELTTCCSLFLQPRLPSLCV